MYSYIKGNIEEINLDSLVIEANNIGYKVNASSNTIASVKLGLLTDNARKKMEINKQGYDTLLS